MDTTFATFYSSFYMSTWDLHFLETELKKRCAYLYQWGQKQNNHWDSYTSFIYDTPHWDSFIALLKQTHQTLQVDKGMLFDYAANRWFNFWSAVAIEQIFKTSLHITAVQNPKDREKDFILHGIAFDHKTSVFPKGFKKSITYAKTNKPQLITWLYKNQSEEQRFHLKNRLFVIVHHRNGAHWKLKAELTHLKTEIEKYLTNFNTNQLHSFNFEENNETLSDIIWVTS